jgi:uncharacterized membrane protein
MKRIQIELKWAFIFTIVMLCWMLLEKTLGRHDEQIANHWWLTLFFIPFAILMYVLLMREKRRRYYKNKLSWKRGFLTGCIMTVFVTLLSPLAQYITHNFITPQYFENVKNYSVTNDLMTIETANEYFNISNYMLQSAIGALVMGILTSAIVAIFMKRS